MTEVQYPWQQETIIRHTQSLLRSYQHWTGQLLFDLDMAPSDVAQFLFEAPFVVISHGIEANPIFNYGNQTALRLWELDWDKFIQTPSRETAEPLVREEREKLLEETQKRGFVENYSGVRISSTGKRFYVENLLIWNVLGENNDHCGQAAMFYKWKYV